MIKLKTINKEKVKPLKTIQQLKPEKIKGYDVFPSCFSNIFICAKKNSGKTTNIMNILKKCINRNTKIFFFVSTIHKDQTYGEILKMLDKMNIEYETYTTLQEGKMNYLENIINQLQLEPESGSESDEEEIKKNIRFIVCDEAEQEKDKKKYKPKKIGPKYVFIFDDLSGELRSPIISQLIKKNRHFKSKIICSSQSLHDLTPSSIMNLDYILLYPNIPQEKLEIAHKNLDLDISFDLFYDLYKNATKDKYNFLYVDIRNDKLRKNYNQEYNIDI